MGGRSLLVSDEAGILYVRVAEAPAPEPRLARLVGAKVAYAGCTAPGGGGE